MFYLSLIWVCALDLEHIGKLFSGLKKIRASITISWIGLRGIKEVNIPNHLFKSSLKVINSLLFKYQGLWLDVNRNGRVRNFKIHSYIKEWEYLQNGQNNFFRTLEITQRPAAIQEAFKKKKSLNLGRNSKVYGFKLV